MIETGQMENTAEILELRIFCTSAVSVIFRDKEHGVVDIPQWLVSRISGLQPKVMVEHQISPQNAKPMYTIQTDNWDE